MTARRAVLSVISSGCGGLTLCLILPVAGCDQGSGEAAIARRPPKPVAVERIEMVDLRRHTTVLGIVEAETQISLAFRVSGFVESVFVDEGQAIAAGDLLARLDRDDLDREVRAAHAAVDRAGAQAEQAQLAHRRHRALLGKHSVSREQFDAARSAARAAGAAAEEARIHLEIATDRLAKTELRSPVAGFVEQRLVDSHEPVAKAQPAFVVTALDPIHVRASVADDRLAMVRADLEVKLRTPAAPGTTLTGRIDHVAVAADLETRTIPFEVELSNADHLLKPNMVVEIELPAASGIRGVTIPISAVLRGGDLVPFAYAVEETDGETRAVRRALELGEVFGERIAVRGGVREGDRIVTRGQHLLIAGDALRVVE